MIKGLLFVQVHLRATVYRTRTAQNTPPSIYAAFRERSSAATTPPCRKHSPLNYIIQNINECINGIFN